jgi:hypothetical protein
VITALFSVLRIPFCPSKTYFHPPSPPSDMKKDFDLGELKLHIAYLHRHTITWSLDSAAIADDHALLTLGGVQQRPVAAQLPGGVTVAFPSIGKAGEVIDSNSLAIEKAATASERYRGAMWRWAVPSEVRRQALAPTDAASALAALRANR